MHISAKTAILVGKHPTSNTLVRNVEIVVISIRQMMYKCSSPNSLKKNLLMLRFVNKENKYISYISVIFLQRETIFVTSCLFSPKLKVFGKGFFSTTQE